MPSTSLGSSAISQRARSFTRNAPPRNVASACSSARAVTICGTAWRTRAGAPLSTLSRRALVRLSKYSESRRLPRELSKSTRNEARTSPSGGGGGEGKTHRGGPPPPHPPRGGGPPPAAAGGGDPPPPPRRGAAARAPRGAGLGRGGGAARG